LTFMPLSPTLTWWDNVQSSKTSSSLLQVKHLLCRMFCHSYLSTSMVLFSSGKDKNFLTRERFNNAHFTIEIVFSNDKSFLQTWLERQLYCNFSSTGKILSGKSPQFLGIVINSPFNQLKLVHSSHQLCLCVVSVMYPLLVLSQNQVERI
jgi:hypothetical protein